MINYGLLTEAIDFYESLGFTYIEVPWATSQEAQDLTRPPDGSLFPLEGKYLVASAEQSLLQLALEGGLKQGAYVTCTPCFRGDRLDETHHRYFMKVELMVYQPEVPEAALEKVLAAARDFFSGYVRTKTVRLSDGSYDLESSRGIELGSYGIRNHESVGTWVYGTGVAEPRLTYACSKE